MSTKNVLLIDNDLASAETLESLFSNNKFVPHLLIGLEELEPVIKGYDRNVQRIELIPQQFPPVAFVADTLGGILTPTDEIIRVLHKRNVCCIATTITKQPTLAHADFGISRLNIVDWAQKWLPPVYAVATRPKPGRIDAGEGARKILVINQNEKFGRLMTELLIAYGYPCFEPITKVLRLVDGTVTGYSDSMSEVEIKLKDLAVIFVAASSNEQSGEAPSREIVQSARAMGVCCVSTSLNQNRTLPEADFMIDETKRQRFVELWMKAIYPTACNTVCRS
jgi:hypothetical protein